MPATMLRTTDAEIVPEPGEKQIRELNRMLQLGAPALVGVDGTRLVLPDAIFQILKGVVSGLRSGRVVTLTSAEEQLSTQRAAGMIGASRPHLIKLLETGKLPYFKVGKHRRVLRADVEAYMTRRDAERKAALDSIAKEAFELGLYDRTGIPEGGED